MKRSGIAFLLLALLLAGTSLAGPPLQGAYKSVDYGGVVYLGRYSEGWDAGGSAVQAGTTLNAQSWSGTVLGTQWKYWCATESMDGFIWIDNVDANGNGNRVYLKSFAGGYIWLSGSGPWANGDPDYPGVITSYNETETVTYQNWVPIAANTSVNATARFDGYDACLGFTIGNGARVGTTDLGNVKPADYPDFMDPGCGIGNRTLGAWWDFHDITLSITGCVVPVEDATWGAIKAIYSE